MNNVLQFKPLAEQPVETRLRVRRAIADRTRTAYDVWAEAYVAFWLGWLS